MFFMIIYTPDNIFQLRRPKNEGNWSQKLKNYTCNLAWHKDKFRHIYSTCVDETWEHEFQLVTVPS